MDSGRKAGIVSSVARILRRESPFVDFHGSSDDLKSTSRQLPLVVLPQVVRLLLFLGSTYLLTMLLEPTDFGRLLMVGVPFGFVMVFGDFGLGDGVVRSKNMDSALASFFVWANLTVAVFSSVLLVLVMPLFEIWFENDNLWNLGLAFSAVILLNGILPQYRALLRRQLRLDSLSVTEVGVTAVSSCASVGAAFAGWGAFSVPFGKSLGLLFELVALVHLTGWIPGRPSTFARARGIFSFGWRLAVSGMFQFGMGALSFFVLGRYYAADALGFIERAIALSQGIVQRFSTVLMRVAYPVLSRQVHSSAAQGNRVATRLILLAADLWIVPVACVVSLSTPLVDVAFAAEWEGLGYYLGWAYVGLLFWMPGRFATALLLANGHSGSLLRINLSLFIVRMIVTVVGVFQGLEIYVALVGISEAIGGIALILIAGRKCGADWKAWITRCGLCFGIGMVCILLIQLLAMFASSLSILLGAFLVMSIGLAMRLLRSSEVRYLITALRERDSSSETPEVCSQ